MKNYKYNNISKANTLTQKTKLIRNSQTPIKNETENNTIIYPNNNYNINNNISININIDMTNERNKSFNLKNKNRSKPNKLKKDKIILNNNNNNNNLIYNTVKNFQNKSNVKKSPFHIRIKSANLTIKDFKYKPRVNTRNKVYQNRFKRKSKSKELKNEIFTEKKQKEEKIKNIFKNVQQINNLYKITLKNSDFSNMNLNYEEEEEFLTYNECETEEELINK